MPQPALPSPIAAEEIFRVAAATPAAERAAYLETACAGQPAVRARLERMLQAHDIGAFLRRGADDTGAAELEAELACAQPEQAGERIGHYQLLERLGEGGFGVVWVAAQEQPVRRQVALKIIKLGMDTREVIARFEQERQALALMDHPHIAKVFDAGATPTGRPYFVMELVRGIPITDYCDAAQLPTADRLQLFIAVCQAVQHAHQKGIIHRDLKPSNILVAVQDGVAVPKVIDFGVAKATQSQRLGALTIQTGLAQMIGTPLYMSPEQAESGALDIDTRADIYALGVLLYELLTGRTPFDPEELMRAGLDEMRRIIREVEPPRPSTVVRRSTAVPAVGPAGVPPAEADPGSTGRRDARLPHSRDGCATARLSTDLDWIVMKALEKDRTRRYETASDFALDVRRHLASEPVAARAPSFGYQAGKFVRRNRRVVVAAGAVFIALLAGLIASTVLYLRERTAWTSEAAQRQKAEASAQIAEQNAAAEAAARKEAEAIATFLTEVFQSPDPTRDGRTITVAEMLDRAAGKLETDLAGQPARRTSLQATLARTYQTLGLVREAIPLRQKVRDYLLANSGQDNARTLAAVGDLASAYAEAGRLDEALRLREEVLTLRRKLLGPEHSNTIGAMGDLANSYAKAGRQGEALKLREEALSLSRKTLGPEHPETLRGMNNLGISYAESGQVGEALALREQTLALKRKVLGPEHPETLGAVRNLAASYATADRPVEAIKLQEEVLTLQRKILGPQHPATLATMNHLALLYANAARWDDALKLQEEVLTLRKKVLGPEHSETLGAMTNLARSYDGVGRLSEAVALQKEALALKRRLLPPTHPYLAVALTRMADFEEKSGHSLEARSLREELLAFWAKPGNAAQPSTLRAVHSQAHSYGATGRLDDAVRLLAETAASRPKDTLFAFRVATIEAWFARDAAHAATCRWVLGEAKDATEPTTAERAAKGYCLRPSSDPALLDQALNLARRAVDLGKDHKYLYYFRLTLGMAEYRAGHAAAAEQTLVAAEQLAGSRSFARDPARFFRAMSLFRQGREPEARQLFAETAKTLKPLPTDEHQFLAASANTDDLVVWLAHREAKALIEEKP